jgi:DNA-directed RNA polymerase subunit M/transcription elongation factor TFIIS
LSEERVVKKIEIGDEFRVCPNCGYEDGFHNMFRKNGDDGKMGWYFICPRCSSTYDIGLEVPAV